MTRSRYEARFERLREHGEGAFIPFVTLGDPDRDTSARILETLLESGADGLELGLPFSDPVADGPVIQAAATRALSNGATFASSLGLVAHARALAPEVPIGILGYANLAWRPGVARFMAELAAAGADSVLLADVPNEESAPFRAAARARGLDWITIVPPNADPRRMAVLAAATEGYTYVTTRSGVTGAHEGPDRAVAATLERLRGLRAAPAVLGFGISTPAHARLGIEAGAAGVIAGSAIVRRIDEHRGDPDRLRAEIARYGRAMKAATRAAEHAV